ncbi:MAG: hypothetical protein NW241_17850 [Bacteroidia bacterium]|nr:hypothetical protein [Bacteroidia bacterium]
MKRIPSLRIWLPATAVALLIGLLLLWLTGRRQPVDWKPTYASADSAPFASSLLLHLLDGRVPGDTVLPVRMRLFERLAFEFDPETAYLLVGKRAYLDSLDIAELIRYAERGHSVLIAADQLPEALADTLGLIQLPEPSGPADSLTVQAGQDMQTRIPAWHLAYVFSAWPPDAAPLIRTADGNALALRIPVGSGQVLACLSPRMFTNYYLLHPEWISLPDQVLASVEGRLLLWDEFYKSRRGSTPPRRPDEPRPNLLAYFMQHAALRWALITAFAGLLLYVFSEGKRLQRVIPVIRPRPNTSLQFADTIGRLYFQRGDHRNLAEKKIRILLEHIRTHYGMHPPPALNHESFISQLARKSGHSTGAVRKLCRQVDLLRAAGEIDAEQLTAFAQEADVFMQPASTPQSA